jgi:hypothetical protein
MKSLVLILSAFATVSVAHASPEILGEKAGNGGKIVICPTIDGDRYEVLDYHRAEKEFGLKRITSIPGSDEFAQAKNLIKRIARINPLRATRYLGDLEQFHSQAAFLKDSDFPQSDDTNEVAYCKGGTVVQAITQRTPMTSFEKRYLVNQDHWNHLSTFQRAILLTHEMALREALAYGYTTADGAARMNAILFAADLSTFSREQLEELLLSTGLLYLARVDPEDTEPTISENVRIVRNLKKHGGPARLTTPLASFDFLDRVGVANDFRFPLIGNVVLEDEVDDGRGFPQKNRTDYFKSLAKAEKLKGFLSVHVNSNDGKVYGSSPVAEDEDRSDGGFGPRVIE